MQLKSLTCTLLALFLFQMAQTAQTSALVDTTGDESAEIENDNRSLKAAAGLADEKQLSNIICLEAKSAAGEAVADIEALDEALGGIFEKITALGIVMEKPDYQNKAQDLASRIEDVCSAQTLDGQVAKIDSLSESLTALKYTLRAELNENFNSVIEPELKKKGDELKAKAQERLNGEGKSLQQAAGEKLKKEAGDETARIKSELEAELKVRAEKELKRRAGNGEYGEEPGQETLRVEGEKLLAEMVIQEEARAEAELTAKYDQLAENESQLIQKQLEEKAGDDEKKYEAIRQAFTGLRENVTALQEAKYKEKWENFKLEARREKTRLIEALLDKQIKAAAIIIHDNAKDMDTAKNEGRLAGFDYKSADDLASGLEKNKTALVAALVNTDAPQEALKKRDEFMNQWQNIKDILEVSKIKATEDILDKIERDIKPNELKGRISRTKSHFESVLANYLKRRAYCDANPRITAPSKSGQISACTYCRSIKEYDIQAQFAQNAIAQYDLALKSLDELNDLKNNQAAAVDDALKFKDQFIANIKPLSGLEAEYEPIYQSFQEAMRQNRETCLSHINK